MNCVSCDIDYAFTTFVFLCVFRLGYSSAPLTRVAGLDSASQCENNNNCYNTGVMYTGTHQVRAMFRSYPARGCHRTPHV